MTMTTNKFNGCPPVLALVAAFLWGVLGVDAMANGQGLHGESGKVFRADVDARQFELLTETLVVPTADEGRSRHTVYWDNDTRFVRVDRQNTFKGLTQPTRAYIQKLKNDDAPTPGEPLVCLDVTLLAAGDDASQFPADDRHLLLPFTPDPDSDKHRGATVVIDGRDTPLRLRGPRAQIDIRTDVSEGLLRDGFWGARVFGEREAGGRFVASQIDLRPRVDPRSTDDPGLPRVLIVGDSISMNYFDALKKHLEGVANVHRIDGNGGPSDRGVACMELWLGDYTQPGLHWDVIQFNHGLHDLKQFYDERSETYGKHQITIDQYKQNLAKEIEIMKRTGATLMWCDTTPVPSSSVGVWGGVKMGRRHGEEKVFNNAAREVLKGHPDILINELGNAVTRDEPFEKWWDGQDVHFWDGRQQEVVGKYVADQIKRALKVRAERAAQQQE